MNYHLPIDFGKFSLHMVHETSKTGAEGSGKTSKG